MLTSLSFRIGEAGDAERVAAFVNAAYRGESSLQGWTTEAILLGGQRTDAELVDALITQPNSCILLAEIDQQLMGCIHLERHGQHAHLGMLSVFPQHQNQGIGKALMHAAETYAQEYWQATTTTMSVITVRHELIAFYERHGYQRTGRHLPFPDSERYGIRKVKKLELEILEKILE